MPTRRLTNSFRVASGLGSRFDTCLVRLKRALRNFMALCVLDTLWRLWPGPTSN
jgi:hypothetical protein